MIHIFLARHAFLRCLYQPLIHELQLAKSCKFFNLTDMNSTKPSRLPVPNPVPSFWNAHPKKFDNYQSTSVLPSVVEVVIIGSGLSGVALSYYLLKDNPNPPSVMLLEARQICSGATGRNGGHVKPDAYSDIPKFAKLFGLETASQLADFEASHVHAVKELVESEKIDCDFHMTRALDVYMNTDHANEIESTYKSLQKLGFVNLRCSSDFGKGCGAGKCS